MQTHSNEIEKRKILKYLRYLGDSFNLQLIIWVGLLDNQCISSPYQGCIRKKGGGSIHFTIKQLNSVHLFFLKNSSDLKIKTPSDLPNFTSNTPLPIHKRKKKTKILVYLYPLPLMGLNYEPIQSRATCTCFESHTHNYLPYPKEIFTPPVPCLTVLPSSSGSSVTT